MHPRVSPDDMEKQVVTPLGLEGKESLISNPGDSLPEGVRFPSVLAGAVTAKPGPIPAAGGF